MSRMALSKDDFRRFSVIWEFRVTGNWVEAHVASRVKMGLEEISWHLLPWTNFQLSIKRARNYNCFELISRLFFVWHEHFSGVIFHSDGENLCFLGKKSQSISKWLTVSSVKHQPEGGCSTERTERKEGRKWIIWIFITSFFHLLYSFTKRR